jgi:hypothetical protein
MHLCMYVHTYYVLIKPPMPIHYVLAAVFASCFYVLKSLLHEWGHIFYYVRFAVFASCFYVLFKFWFVREATQGGTLLNPLYPSLRQKHGGKIWLLIQIFFFLLSFFLHELRYIHIYVFMHTCMHTCIYGYMWMYVCMHACMQVCQSFLLVCMYQHPLSLSLSHTHTHTHTHTNTHTYTHTHTRSLSVSLTVSRSL